MNPEELVIHANFVRNLARSLIRDPNAAEDVSQQTLLAALESPPAHGVMGQWLSRVTRNLAYLRFRREKNLRKRERAAAAPEVMPSAAAIASREEMHRLLLEAVLALKEPYRSAVYLRFYEGLSARQVARKTEAPLATARSRIQRGLEQLRLKLERHYQASGRSWGAALLPFAGGKVFYPGILSGVWGMATAIKSVLGVVVLGVALLVAILAVIFDWPEGQGLPEGSQQHPAQTTRVSHSNGEEVRPAEPEERPGSPGKSKEPLPAQQLSYCPEISGRVVDATTGSPVAGVFVLSMGQRSDGEYDYDESTESDVEGAFVFTDLDNKPHKILACHDDYAEGFVITQPEQKTVQVYLHKIERYAIHGTVHDDQYQPMPGIQVSLFRAGESVPERQPTDDQGRYGFEDLEPDQYRLQACNPARSLSRKISRVVFENTAADLDRIRIRHVFREQELQGVFSDTGEAQVFSSETRQVRLIDRDLEVDFGLHENPLLATWQGRVLDAQGKALPHQAIFMAGLDDQWACQVSGDATGRFQFNKIALGTYRVSLARYTHAVDAYHEWTPITFNRPGLLKRDIVLPGGSISGKILHAKVATLHRVWAVLEESPPRIFKSLVHQDGAFSLSCLPAGTYRLYSAFYAANTQCYFPFKCLGPEVRLKPAETVTGLEWREPTWGGLWLHLKGYPQEEIEDEDAELSPDRYFEVDLESRENNKILTRGPFYLSAKGTSSTVYYLETGNWSLTIRGGLTGTVVKHVYLDGEETLHLDIAPE